MKLKSLIRKSLAKVPSDFSGQQRRFAESVSENLDVLTGRRGNIIDRAVTFRDLLDTGVLELASGLVTSGDTINTVSVVNPNSTATNYVDFPSQPTNLTAAGGFGRIYLTWNLPPYRGHQKIEIFRHTTNVLSAAQAAGVYWDYFGDANFWYDIGLDSNTTYFYWVRAVNVLGARSAFNSSSGTGATTSIDYLQVSAWIDDILDDDVNNLGLNAAIDNAGADVTQIQQDISDIETDIATLNSINPWSSSTTYTADQFVTHSGKIWKASQGSTNQTPSASSSYWTDMGTYTSLADFVSATQDQGASTLATLSTNYYTISGVNSAISAATTNLASQSYVQTELADYTTTADLQQNYYTKTAADSAIASATTGLASTTYVQNELSDYTNTATLQQNYYTKTDTDSAISTGISTFTTTVNGDTLTLQQHHSSIDGIEGKYSVKIDNNGNIAGFGLISNANTGVPTSGTGSAFIVAADRFAISADYNVNASELGAVGTNYPFKVITTTTNVTDANGNQAYDSNGVAMTIPAGVYIKDAFIHNGQITSANIEHGTITDANIGSLDAGKITSGQIQIDNQNNFAIFQGKTQVINSETVGNFNSTASGFFLGNVNGYGAFHIGNSSSYVKFNGGTGLFEATGAIIKDLSVTTLKIADDAVTVPDGVSGNITTTLGTTAVKVGELTVDYGDPAHTPSGVIVVAGVQVSGNSSGSDQSLNVEIRRVYTANSTYNGQHVAESVRYNFGHVTTIGAQFAISQVGASTTTYKLELWASVNTGSRTANRYFIHAITSKK